jgi:uncharacterized HAD superfamily protein
MGMGGAQNTDRILKHIKENHQISFQESRQDFMKRIDWKWFKKEYHEVVSGVEAD